MRDPLHGRSGRRSAGFLRWAERLLVTAGAAMLVWCVLLVVDAGLSQRAARQSLAAETPAASPIAPPPPDAAPRPSPPAPTVVVRGSAIGSLSIPRVRLSAIVLHGSDARTLRRGPGHLENTALPGDSGNVVIAGHRDSFFRPLRNVRLGDDIFLDTPGERFRYRVTSLRVVHPRDLSVLEPTGEATLTLITCYPFWVLGNAPDRYIVRATRVTHAAEAAATIPASSIVAPTPAPRVRERAPAAAVPSLPQAPAHDDETLVRQAVERFRITYNARLVSHNDERPGGSLRFRPCEIVVNDESAAATCEASSGSSDDAAPDVWTLTLEPADEGWAIRAISVE